MQIHPSPLAIALAIILSTSSVSVDAAPFRIYPAFPSFNKHTNSPILEPRQGYHQRNERLQHTSPNPTPAATVTSFKTVTVHPTPLLTPRVEQFLDPIVGGGTMRPVTTLSSSPTSDSAIAPHSSFQASSSATPTITSTTKKTQPSVIEISLLSSSFFFTIPTPTLSLVVPTPDLSALTKTNNIVIPTDASTSATPTASEEPEQSSVSSSQQTCPASATRKCCTSLQQVSNGLLEIIDDILPGLHLSKLKSDSTRSNPVGLTCATLADDEVCDEVVSCCTEETIVSCSSHLVVLLWIKMS
ncbi:hypothetical protein BGW36DRAFT_112049 [Talaromyces proteolyticus]|uniref:Hydrophobin n=1 Tax=Talaromyces proteolyticus TaxID=1131652 RepID=A0AAD4KVT5_9EURO|nr:uncharacterized protein BGW36DRAFT_112049 [Talaromyces proteolyticus]KAH8702147.1 hypothetical protein BGW36DRAFT_112049 [Talaromyces proteolyticus]